MSGCCARLKEWFFPCSFKAELKEQVKLSIPIVSLTVLSYMILTTSTIFCGRMGKMEIDAVSLSVSLINALVITPSLGLVEGFETLFTQAFGSTHKRLMGVYLQRSVLLHLLAFLVCLAILLNAEGLCVLLGQNREISYLTGQYLLRFIPGAFGLFFYTLFARYLQDMNLVLPTMVIVIMGNVVNISAHFLFIYGLGLGLYGSAYAVSLADVTMLVMVICYMKCSKKFSVTWPGLSTEMWRGWWKVLRMGLAALLSTCFEWWAFEIGVFLTGLLGVTELGAQTIGMNIDAFAFNILSGIGITSTIRVGQHLGAQDALQAKTACYTTFVYSFIPVSMIVAILLIFNEDIPKIFTNIPDLLKLTSEILPVIALYTFSTSFSTWSSGVFRGSGRQHIAAACFFISFYIIGLPLAIYFMFYTDLRSLGFWVSLVISLTSVSVFMSIIVLRTDWYFQVKKANKNTLANDADDEKKALLKTSRTEEALCTNSTDNNASHDPLKLPAKSQDRENKGINDMVHKRNYYDTYNESDKTTGPNDARVGEECTHKEAPQGTSIVTSLVLMRLAAIMGVLLVLTCGVAIRLFVPLPPLSGGHDTQFQNTTRSLLNW